MNSTVCNLLSQTKCFNSSNKLEILTFDVKYEIEFRIFLNLFSQKWYVYHSKTMHITKRYNFGPRIFKERRNR